MKRYQIWDKTSNVYTPSGEEFTPEQWIERYGWIKNPVAVPVISYGLINGGFIGELSQMKTMCEEMGATFDDSLTNEELLQAIEDYEDSLSVQSSNSVSAEERIAAALEAQVMLSMPDAEDTSSEDTTTATEEV